MNIKVYGIYVQPRRHGTVEHKYSYSTRTGERNKGAEIQKRRTYTCSIHKYIHLCTDVEHKIKEQNTIEDNETWGHKYIRGA